MNGLPLQQSRDPEFRERQFHELARRLGITHDDLMHRSVLEVAKACAELNETGGLRLEVDNG